MARITGGGVDYWIGLPLRELMRWMLELNNQLEEEAKMREKK